MKIRLLNDGGYYGLEGVHFPVEVEAVDEIETYGGCSVATSELIRVGGDTLVMSESGDELFFRNDKFSVVE